MIFLVLWIIAQIVLESLPISSSGHVALLLKLSESFWGKVVLPEHAWVVDFLLHGPTVLILMAYFFSAWWRLVFSQSVNFNLLLAVHGWKRILQAVCFVGTADIITFMFWWIDFFPVLPLYVGFLITAVVLYCTQFFEDQHKKFDWSMHHAILLGIIQGMSLLPGISRFASTYFASKLLGYKNSVAFSVSFMVQVPLILAGFCKGLLAYYKDASVCGDIFDFKILFVILIASVISYGMLSVVEKIISKKKLWYLSFYMMLPMILALFL